MSTLAIRVDEAILDKFTNASESEKTRWEQAFNLWWQVYFMDSKTEKLGLVVDYFRQKAAERGLTQYELDEILSEKNG